MSLDRPDLPRELSRDISPDIDADVENRSHRDPITGAPGAHPVGTGLGAAAGGLAAGALAGTVVGPVGTVIGAAIGALAGGLAGKGVAELVDPTAEGAYWRDNYTQRDYVEPGAAWDDYEPAYRYGVDAYGMGMTTGPGGFFDDNHDRLAEGWDRARGDSSLSWDRAKHAVRDSWERASDRVERAVPGDSDRDGK
jgi:hypothetical protein